MQFDSKAAQRLGDLITFRQRLMQQFELFVGLLIFLMDNKMLGIRETQQIIAGKLLHSLLQQLFTLVCALLHIKNSRQQNPYFRIILFQLQRLSQLLLCSNLIFLSKIGNSQRIVRPRVTLMAFSQALDQLQPKLLVITLCNNSRNLDKSVTLLCFSSLHQRVYRLHSPLPVAGIDAQHQQRLPCIQVIRSQLSPQFRRLCDRFRFQVQTDMGSAAGNGDLVGGNQDLHIVLKCSCEITIMRSNLRRQVMRHKFG